MYEHEVHGASAETTFQSILANYIDLGQNPGLQESPSPNALPDADLVKVFDDSALNHLTSRGYDIEDVVSWAWVIQAPTAFDAAVRLLALSNQPLPKSRIPTFVPLFVLRRTDFTPAGLQLLLLHVWDRLQNRLNMSWESLLSGHPSPNSQLPMSASEVAQRDPNGKANYPRLPDDAIALLVVRLLRHVRNKWPIAIPNIVELCTKNIVVSEKAGSTSRAIPFRTSRRLTFLFNKLLCLVALPPAKHAFLSVVHQERAQFNIIRKMNEFDPALTINKDGYRAIIQVQIAHRKTLQERGWALLKAKSWPPWKEDKLGIDADKGVEMGISRAYRAIKSSRESGYAPEIWENSASILSGWDTDQSPTIQTRTIFPRAPSPRLVTTIKDIQDEPPDQMLWEARIRATRTIEEAWACFLAYQNQRSSAPSRNIYLAMFQKIAYERKRNAENSISQVNELSLGPPVVSGDMLETEASSTNPRDMIYLRKPPPDFESFRHQMMSDGIRNYGRTLEFLLYHAETLSKGCEYLLCSDVNQSIKAMLVPYKDIDASILKSVPSGIFTAFIHLLTRFPASQLKYKPLDSPKDLSKNSLVHACQLMFAVMPPYRRPWVFLLSSLDDPKALPFQRHAFGLPWRGHPQVNSWRSVIWIVDQMKRIDLDPDFDCFQILCKQFEKLAVASKQVPSMSSSTSRAVSEFLSENPLKAELAKLKLVFRRLVSIDLQEDLTPGDSKTPFRRHLNKDATFDPYNFLPHLLEVPDPAKLHRFVRALGSADDYGGLRDLIRWMSWMYPELDVVVRELAGGPRMWRRTLIAARVYLERNIDPLVDTEEDVEWANQDRLFLGDEIRTIIEEQPDWGGWPTDKEVDKYVRYVRRC